MEYIVTIRILDPRADLLAVKESLACYCERFGDISLVDIRAVEPRQEKIWRGKC